MNRALLVMLGLSMGALSPQPAEAQETGGEHDAAKGGSKAGSGKPAATGGARGRKKLPKKAKASEPVPKAKRGKQRLAARVDATPAVGEGDAAAVPPVADRAKTPPPPPLAAEDVRTEQGKEVKALEFSGLDIEGQLKSPQMLYFLKRVRAEFERPRLPHRSFMPELDRSTEEREF